MTGAPAMDARTGRLWLAEETFAALLAHATSTAGGPGTPEQLDLLRSVGAIDGHGRPHDALAGSLAALAKPTLGTVELSYAGQAMRGWVGDDGAAVLMPAGDDGRRLLTHFPLSLVPGALAKMVDLGSRPRAVPATPVRYQEGALQGVRRHWVLTFEWGQESGVGEASTLEVVDTDGGLWTVRTGDDGERTAWPSTPTRVWRQIVRLVLHRPV